ncbi:hypothetical protein FDB37_16280 [Clostridium botulinum]|uniref:hypothetical protein n=1 Tax=Clostridium botulinum TaxID=1491 RepID=UPI000A87FD36|nr:hypothetical protein [Clostridium botulinum]NFO35126.1 hypothetical protein [Clostridium botulinum]NFO48396.1 hypothetical protein [Clostridium botulinum]NFO58633.1 hypothetical protein [Clostridium botulinum]
MRCTNLATHYVESHKNDCYNCMYFSINEEQRICKKYKVSLGKVEDISVRYCTLYETKNFKSIDHFSR